MTNSTDTNDTKVLKLDGFTMLPVRASDLDSFVKIWTDPEVTRFLPSRGDRISRERARKSLTSFLKIWVQRDYGIWVIVNDATLETIGYCGLRYLDELDEVELL